MMHVISVYLLRVSSIEDLFVVLSGPGNFCLVHVSLVPVLNVVGEQVSLITHLPAVQLVI